MKAKAAMEASWEVNGWGPRKRSLLSAIADRRRLRGPPQALQSLRLNVDAAHSSSAPDKPHAVPSDETDALRPDVRPSDARIEGPPPDPPAEPEPGPNAVERELSPCSCQICGAALGSLSLIERQHHANACLDATAGAPQEGGCESGGEPALEQSPAQRIGCPLCAHDIGALTVAQRVQHVDACTAEAGDDDDAFEQGRPLGRAGGAHAAARVEQGLRCQLCGLDLLRLAVAQRHAHVTNCLERAQPRAAPGKRARGRPASSAAKPSAPSADASHCALCSMALHGLTPKQRIAHIRTCAKASGLTPQQLQAMFAQRAHAPAPLAPSPFHAAAAPAAELAAAAPPARGGALDCASLAFHGHERQARLARAAPTQPLGPATPCPSLLASPLRLWQHAAVASTPAGRSDPLAAGRRAAAETRRALLAEAEAEPSLLPAHPGADEGASEAEGEAEGDREGDREGAGGGGADAGEGDDTELAGAETELDEDDDGDACALASRSPLSAVPEASPSRGDSQSGSAGGSAAGSRDDAAEALLLAMAQTQQSPPAARAASPPAALPEMCVVVEWACVDVAVALCHVVRSTHTLADGAACVAGGAGAGSDPPARLCDFAARGVLDAFDLALDLLDQGRQPAEIDAYWQCEVPLGLRRLLESSADDELRASGVAHADAARRMRASIAQLRERYAQALSICGYDCALPSDTVVAVGCAAG